MRLIVYLEGGRYLITLLDTCWALDITLDMNDSGLTQVYETWQPKFKQD